MEWSDRQPQPAALLDESRDERETGEAVAQWIVRPDQLRLAKALAVTRTQYIRGEQDALATRIDFENRDAKVRVGPGRSRSRQTV